MDNALKALIRRTETGKTDPAVQYNTIIGHNEKRLPKPVTDMTVDEIIAASDLWRKKFGTTSGAAGAYQIIKPTLVQLKKDLGLKGSEKFTPALQDEMCDALLAKRGIGQFLAGALSTTAFGNNLAREWASFPVLSAQKRGAQELKRGQSYYDKFAGNSALIKPQEVETVLALLLAGPAAEPAPLPDAPVDVTPADIDVKQGGFKLSYVVVAILIGLALLAWFLFGR